MFDDPVERMQAVAIPLLYGVIEAVVIGTYCVVAWKIGWTKAPPDEDICTVVSTSYEQDDEDEQLNANSNSSGHQQRRRQSSLSDGNQRRSPSASSLNKDRAQPFTGDDRRKSGLSSSSSSIQRQQQQQQQRVSEDYRGFGPTTGTKTVTSQNLPINAV